MAWGKEKIIALKLRKDGAGIGEIASKLNVSKSTVSYWCKDIVLTKEQFKKILSNTAFRRNAGSLKGAEQKRKERINRVEYWKRQGLRDVGDITKRDLFVAGLALYWGEGYKKGSMETAITNSDPSIISLYIKWLKEIYCVDKKDLILRVSINESHKNREEIVNKYWAKITGISRSQFTKTSFIKSKSSKIYSNANEHFGTLRVKARRGTNLRYRILGSIEALGHINQF